MDPRQRQLITAANRQAWEVSAPLHAQGEEWQRLLEQAGQPGFSVLDACLTATLTGLDIRGLSCAQVGCNNARELLSLAPFSPRANNWPRQRAWRRGWWRPTSMPCPLGSASTTWC